MSKSFISNGLVLFEDNKEDPNVAKIILTFANETYPNWTTQRPAISKLKKAIIATYDGQATPANVKLIGSQPDAKNQPNVNQLGLALYEKTKDAKQIIDFVTTKYANISSRATTLSNIKKTILTKYPDASKAIKHMVLPGGDYKKLTTKLDKSLQSKVKNCLDIKEGDEFVNNILQGLISTKPADLFTALCLATGRRTTEVLQTGSIKPLKNNPYQAQFTGQLKKKDNEPTTYTIPLLAPYRLVIKSWDRLRDIITEHPQYTHTATLNRYVKRVVGRDDITPHTLRSIYAVACYIKYAPEKQTINSYISEILGHEGMNSSVHYNCVNIEGLSNEPWKLSLSNFKHDESKAQMRAVENIITLISEDKNITVNAIRNLGSSPAVIRKVIAANRQVIDLL